MGIFWYEQKQGEQRLNFLENLRKNWSYFDKYFKRTKYREFHARRSEKTKSYFYISNEASKTHYRSTIKQAKWKFKSRMSDS